MKTFKMLLVVAAAMLALASCDKTGKDVNPVPVSVSMENFGFTAESNPGLVSDVIVTVGSENNIKISLPFGFPASALQNLVPTFSVPENASVTFNGEPFDIGDTYDFSEPVDIVISIDEKSNAMYTVTVEIQSAPNWMKVAESEIEMGCEPYLAINPVDNVPYLLGYQRNLKDGTLEASMNYPDLLRLEGNTLKSVCGALIEERASYFGLGFSPAGNAYVSLGNYTMIDGTIKSSAQRTQVYKVTSSGAVKLGSDLVTVGGNTVTSNAVVAISDNEIYDVFFSNAAVTGLGLAKRGVDCAKFDGTSWTDGGQISDREKSITTYEIITKTVAGVPYVLILNFSLISVSLYKYEDNAWTTVFHDMKPLRTDRENPISTADYQYSSLDFDVASNGDVYVFASADFQTAGTKEYGVVRARRVVNAGDTGPVESWEQSLVGGVIKAATHAQARYASFALDANDNIFVVWSNAIKDTEIKTSVTWIDPETRLWAEPVVLTDVKTEGAVIRFAEDGTGYIGYHDMATNKYVLCSNK